MHPYSHCDATIDANARVPYGTLDMKSTLSNKVPLFDLQSVCKLFHGKPFINSGAR